MRSLRLVGLSEDGQRVVFVDDAGAEFACPADDRLRTALRGDRVRLGQLEIQMDSALRPRDIQARIRAGDSPETVAALAQVGVERVMPYCLPVLAERQHIAEVARRSHVRRGSTDGAARTLSALVTERLRGRGVDPESAKWDAWRRDDSRWTVSTTYHSGESERTATFVFDAMGRYSLADDDEAKWITGERQSSSKGPQPREAGRRRLAAVPAEDDLLRLSEEGTDDLTAMVRLVRESGQQTTAHDHEAAEVSTGAETDAGAATSVALDAGSAGPATGSSDDVTEGVQAEAAAAASRSRRKVRQRRASVPSWDEIMLGTGPKR
ncbi:MAG TPA: septation protein SepH [Nocardioidaceae bacterium]|nr:septation protein SepH [Nocardioidaceae bacterium]